MIINKFSVDKQVQVVWKRVNRTSGAKVRESALRSNEPKYDEKSCNVWFALRHSTLSHGIRTWASCRASCCARLVTRAASLRALPLLCASARCFVFFFRVKNENSRCENTSVLSSVDRSSVFHSNGAGHKFRTKINRKPSATVLLQHMSRFFKLHPFESPVRFDYSLTFHYRNKQIKFKTFLILFLTFFCWG